MKKPKKKRADHYEKPLHIEGTFDDVISVAMGKAKEAKQQEQPKPEEKLKEEPKK